MLNINCPGHNLRTVRGIDLKLHMELDGKDKKRDVMSDKATSAERVRAGGVGGHGYVSLLLY